MIKLYNLTSAMVSVFFHLLPSNNNQEIHSYELFLETLKENRLFFPFVKDS